MAQEMLKIWDPTVEPTGRGETLNNILPHTFTKPLVINCQLPGKINFLHVLKPGVIVPIQAIIQQESYGTIYVTGDCQGEHPSYFKLHFNSHRKVETIVCYTKRKIDVNNMIRLYGKHERLLNNFVTRFESGDITNLYEYFSEPWCMLIFQDHFDQLENDIRGFLLSPTSCPDKNILADIYKACEETRWNKLTVTNPHTPSSPSVLVLTLTSLLSASDRVSAEVQLNLYQCMDEKYPELLDKFSKSVDKELVEKKLLQHIEDNCYHLTMYAYPKSLKSLDDSVTQLYVKQKTSSLCPLAYATTFIATTPARLQPTCSQQAQNNSATTSSRSRTSKFVVTVRSRPRKDKQTSSAVRT
uniref:CFAP61 dimerisation domain-containing protein n=1 Tax=Timema genevievae TaxID=629358 RepID=A0A7R9K7D6_TIMGE|nr:unnamed protein product [Timema genevievae]